MVNEIRYKGPFISSADAELGASTWSKELIKEIISKKGILKSIDFINQAGQWTLKANIYYT